MADTAKLLKVDHSRISLDQVKWASVRLGFLAMAGVSLGTVVGGFVLAPAASYFFLNDWRFWRHLNKLLKLLPHGYRMFGLVLKGHNRGFLFSVPLTSEPRLAPDRRKVELAPGWCNGDDCAECIRCCEVIECPLVDKERGGCAGYGSLYWRYFNCGRFPTSQTSIDYYGCEKWRMKS